MLFTPNLRPSLRLAFRARFLSFSLWLAIALAIAVPLAANFSGRQPATVGLDVGLSLIRLALPVLTVLLLQELVCREFDRKLYLSSLTYPRPRHSFLFGRVAAIAVLLLGLLAILAALLAGLTTWIGHGYAQATPPDLGLPYLVTIVFIALDLLVDVVRRAFDKRALILEMLDLRRRLAQRDGIESKLIGRPAGVYEGPDGAIYVSDDYGGVIYRVTHTSM